MLRPQAAFEESELQGVQALPRRSSQHVACHVVQVNLETITACSAEQGKIACEKSKQKDGECPISLSPAHSLACQTRGAWKAEKGGERPLPASPQRGLRLLRGLAPAITCAQWPLLAEIWFLPLHRDGASSSSRSQEVRSGVHGSSGPLRSGAFPASPPPPARHPALSANSALDVASRVSRAVVKASLQYSCSLCTPRLDHLLTSTAALLFR